MTKAKPEHYVNNKEFTAAISEHNYAVKQAIKDGKEPPRVSEYIGECIYKIATRLSTKPNFINYSYRDEMICDGIENCLQYINNFNPEKSQNAFAYITQIIYYAFLRRIQKEKKQAAIKHKAIMNSGIIDDAVATIDGETAHYDNSYVDFLQNNLQEPNYKPRGKKKKTDDSRPVGVEKYFNPTKKK
mgnify:FL=1|tara:strand:- start:939 stop:1499 length:561 start_codon:yes stop_codon:yes gene_type:complete